MRKMRVKEVTDFPVTRSHNQKVPDPNSAPGVPDSKSYALCHRPSQLSTYLSLDAVSFLKEVIPIKELWDFTRGLYCPFQDNPKLVYVLKASNISK